MPHLLTINSLKSLIIKKNTVGFYGYCSSDTPSKIKFKINENSNKCRFNPCSHAIKAPIGENVEL